MSHQPLNLTFHFVAVDLDKKFLQSLEDDKRNAPKLEFSFEPLLMSSFIFSCGYGSAQFHDTVFPSKFSRKF